jgi:hypothetical protein
MFRDEEGDIASPGMTEKMDRPRLQGSKGAPAPRSTNAMS